MSSDHARQMDVIRAPKRTRRSPTDYTVACLVPLSVELAPLRAMLDDIHDDIPADSYRNAYVLGELKQHSIVIAPLPSIGNNDSGVVASQLLHDFPSIQFGLLVGIAGGVPGLQDGNDVRLGDVVVSEPKGTLGGIVQFDKGKNLQGNHLQVTGHFNKPPPFLTETVKILAAQHQQQGNMIQHFVSDMILRNPFMKDRFKCPGPDCDNLFESEYKHIGGSDCSECDTTKTVRRHPRPTSETTIHYGTIGSSNAVIRNASERDRLGREHGLLSIEMEAAGLMNTLPCLVIRGICDYADSHKNKDWQPYAAAVAAAYAKELLLSIPSRSVSTTEEVPTSRLVPKLDRTSGTSAVDCQEQQPADDSTELVQSLTFDRMEARRWNIQEPLPETCEWLFRHEYFTRWIEGSNTDDHNQFLWIKGKPGSGKSTLMKTALQWTVENRPSETNISYFFNARASENNEKSTIGLYRSITYQLIDAYPQLKKSFSENFRSKLRSEKSISWTLYELTNFLVQTMRAKVTFDIVVNIFIDALDEGDDEEVRQLVEFMDDLASAAHKTRKSLRICLSSRHYPHITARKSLDLIVEDQTGHEEDIARFVKQKLRCERNSELDTLIHRICEKAAGVFLWAVLVVPMLNKIHDYGGSTTEMTSSLQQIPSKLSSLFGQLLEQFDSDREECLALLQWVLFSDRPLQPHELYLAIQATLVRPKAHCKDMSPDQLKLYLLSRSRGLTEITKLEPYTVQFIHETVRDFLAMHGISQMAPNLKENVVGQCHEVLRMGCELYLRQVGPSIKDIEKMPVKEYEKYIITMSKSEAPLLEYAADTLFWHAEVAARHGIDQHAFTRQYTNRDRKEREYWTRVQNLFRVHWRESASFEYLILYLVASNGLEKVLTSLIEGGININTQLEYGWTALGEACDQGHKQIVRLLIDGGADLNIQAERGYNALTVACRKGHWQIVRLLVDGGADVNIQSGYEGTALIGACKKGHWQVVRLLVERGADVNIQSKGGGTALMEACVKGHEQIVHFLVDKGADVNIQSVYKGTALVQACGGGHEQVVRYLVDKGADINARGGYLGTALIRACGGGHEQVVRYLVERGADVNIQSEDEGTALVHACEGGHEQVVRYLVDKGADINTGGEGWGTALIQACEGGHEQIVRYLVDKGADVNAWGEYWGNALIAACTRGCMGIAHFLIEKGADVRAHVGKRCKALDDARGDKKFASRLKEVGITI